MWTIPRISKFTLLAKNIPTRKLASLLSLMESCDEILMEKKFGKWTSFLELSLINLA